MKPIIPHPATFVLAEVLSSASDMVKEIAHYKRAITELEIQRQQMHEQAKIAHQQIQAQLTQELKRIDCLSANFQQVMQQNQQMIAQHTLRECSVQQQCEILLTQIAQTPDMETKKLLIDMWKALINQIDLNRDVSARLHAQLMDAYQQFGLDVSHRDASFKDVS